MFYVISQTILRASLTTFIAPGSGGIFPFPSPTYVARPNLGTSLTHPPGPPLPSCLDPLLQALPIHERDWCIHNRTVAFAGSRAQLELLQRCTTHLTSATPCPASIRLLLLPPEFLSRGLPRISKRSNQGCRRMSLREPSDKSVGVKRERIVAARQNPTFRPTLPRNTRQHTPPPERAPPPAAPPLAQHSRHRDCDPASTPLFDRH